jgi:hypothetical protein
LITAPQIIEALGQLSNPELKAIQGALDNLLNKQTLDHDLFQIVLQALGQTGSEYLFAQTRNYGVWLKNQRVVTGLVNQMRLARPLKKIEIRRLKQFLVELLLDDLRSKESPLNMRTVSHHMEFMGEIFEENFPGYQSSNLTQLILARLANKPGEHNVTETKGKQTRRHSA